MKRYIRLLAPIIVAVGLGPLIAGLAVCLLAVVTNIFDGTGLSPLADFMGLFVVYIIFAYYTGGAIALLAGILVSVWMIWRPPSALVVIAATVVATAGYMGVGALGLLGLAEMTNARSNFLFTLLLAVIAANICWLLTRRFARTT